MTGRPPVSVPQLIAGTGLVLRPGREECLALLASGPMGRIGFTQRALAVMRPVDHLVDGEPS
ncbi:pyridoxamine 5'-phosphate oxidase family protein [Streptomyces sp. NPDC002092]